MGEMNLSVSTVAGGEMTAGEKHAMRRIVEKHAMRRTAVKTRDETHRNLERQKHETHRDETHRSLQREKHVMRRTVGKTRDGTQQHEQNTR